MAGRDLRAVLLGKPGIDGLFAGQAVKRLSTKPLAPVTVTLAAITGDASAAKVLWYCQAAQHLWDDVVKRGATGAKLLAAVCAAVITSQ